MFIPDPGSWCLPIPDPGSRIPDPGSKNINKRERWKKISCHTFLCSHKFHKIVNYFSFEVLKKKIWANIQRIIELFTKKFVKKVFQVNTVGIGMDTPFTIILLGVERDTPCTFTLQVVERDTGCQVKMDTPFTILLLGAEGDTPCTFIPVVERDTRCQVNTPFTERDTPGAHKIETLPIFWKKPFLDTNTSISRKNKSTWVKLNFISIKNWNHWTLLYSTLWLCTFINHK